MQRITKQSNAPVRLNYVQNVPSRALAGFKRHFQWKVMGQLKSRKRNRTSQGKILIPFSLFEHLKLCYNVSGAFKVNIAFMNPLSLKNVRYWNSSDFCSFDIETVKVRFGRTRKVIYKEKDLQKKELSSGLFMFN